MACAFGSPRGPAGPTALRDRKRVAARIATQGSDRQRMLVIVVIGSFSILRVLRVLKLVGQAARAIRTAALGAHCWASTGGLLTESSPPALQGAQGPRECSSWTAFPT